jgi:opacity protein-like surface antigen
MYGQRSTLIGKADLYSYGGGAQVHVPNGSRVTPYITGGVNGVRIVAKAITYQLGVSDNALALSFGGGARIAVTRHLGVRFEALAVKGRDWDIFGRATVGVYGQFGGR